MRVIRQCPKCGRAFGITWNVDRPEVSNDELRVVVNGHDLHLCPDCYKLSTAEIVKWAKTLDPAPHPGMIIPVDKLGITPP